VQGVGGMSGNIYLDSERDFRDQRSLNIEILPSAQAALLARVDGDVEKMIGKTITVAGTAKRVKIWIYTSLGRSDACYYQTQVAVTDVGQITF
jgi:hypothetical protein